jgi:hypothetical protein
MDARSKLMRSILVNGPVLELGLWLAEDETSEEEATEVVIDESVSTKLESLIKLLKSLVDEGFDEGNASTPQETSAKTTKLTILKYLNFITYLYFQSNRYY